MTPDHSGYLYNIYIYIYIDRGGVGMGKVFQLVILQPLYSVGRGV